MKSQIKIVLILLIISPFITHAQSAPKNQNAQVNSYWTDPGTGFMWTAKDNGKDVSWKGAIKYCTKLRLARYSDWRLPNMFELQPLFDTTANSPGLTGAKNDETTMWHIRGNIYLTGLQWSNSYRLDDRGKPSGYVYYFDFISGKSNDDPTGWPYPYVFRRALCVRGSGDPLAGERQKGL